MLNDKKRMLERGEIFLNSGKKKERIKNKVKISFEMAAQIPNNCGSDNIFFNHTLGKIWLFCPLTKSTNFTEWI